MGEVRAFQSGWSIARLADELGMDRRTATKRLRDAGVPPCGKRGGHDVYRLADAAPALVDPIGPSVESGVVDPRDLPPKDRKDYYQSENERLKVEVTIGQLIPAVEVEADYAELVKKVVKVLDTLPDILERDCALAPEAAETVQKTCDSIRQQLYELAVAEDDDDVRDRA
ncbi:DUF1441 family protein [Luteimonas sp. MJ174]|uniref:DUF1441 family protein n=1 Tax=Luteimonas sp. MJ174 TaxID=3129237 RepID=UPI0031BAC6E5